MANKRFRRLMSALLAASVAFGAGSLANAFVRTASADDSSPSTVDTVDVSVTINKNIEYQQIEGFGAFSGMKPGWEPGNLYTPEFLNLIVDDLGMTMVREEVLSRFEQQNDNDDPNAMDPAIDSLDPNNLAHSAWNINGALPTDSCKSQTASLSDRLDYLKALKAKADASGEPLKMIASVWSPPYWMKYVKCVFGADVNWNKLVMETIPSGEPKQDLKDEFAEWLTAYIKVIKHYTGMDLYAISLQNEPAFAQSYQSAVYTPQELRNVIKYVGKKFEEQGIQTKIFMPEDLGYLTRVFDYIQTAGEDPEARKYADIVAVHGYGQDGVTKDDKTPQDWINTYNLASRYGKELWMTETSGYAPTWDGAMDLAKAINFGLKYGKLSAWVYWQLGEHQPSEYSLIAEGVPTPNYYASKQYYRYVRPGAVQVDSESSDDEVLVTAFTHREQGTNTIVLVNTSSSEKQLQLTFQGGSAPDSFTSYRSSAMENAVNLGAVSGTQPVALPPRSVTTLVGTAADQPLAPSIMSQPQTVHVGEGQSAAFSVEATGTPKLTYQWTHNGVAIPGEDGSSVVVKNALDATSGEYTVTVTSPYGSVTSEPAELILNSFNGLNIVKTNAAPSIDGDVDAAWDAASYADLGKIVIGAPSAPDFAGKAKVMWDDANLYALYEMTDDQLFSPDLVELFIDGGNTKGTSYGADDYQFAFHASGAAPVVEYKHNAVAGVDYKTKTIPGGYSVEVKIPWSTVQIPPTEGSLIGIDLAADDGDDDQGRDAKIAWYTTNNDIWMNPSYMGTGKLAGGDSPNPNPSPAVWSVDASKGVIGQDDNVEVTIGAKQANDLYGFRLAVRFDGSQLELQNVQLSEQFGTADTAALFRKDDANGVTLTGTLLNQEQGKSGDVGLVKLTFQAKTDEALAHITVAAGSQASDSNGVLQSSTSDMQGGFAIANPDVIAPEGVMLNDLVLVAKAFGKTGGAYQSRYDMDKDGKVDIVDIVFVAEKLLAPLGN